MSSGAGHHGIPHDAHFGSGESFDRVASSRLNRAYSSTFKTPTRVEEMQLEINDELQGAGRLAPQLFGEMTPEKLVAIDQVYHWAWTRTFVDRLHEMIRRYGDGTYATALAIEQDLIQAWRKVEAVINGEVEAAVSATD